MKANVTRKLLRDCEPPAVGVLRASASSPFFIICDHASNYFPEALGDLGLSASDRERHIAWDIGALGVSRKLSELLDATLVYHNYSRLVIDVNRDPARKDSIPAISEATDVPGNKGLSEEDKELRRAELFVPYHEAIERTMRQYECDRRPTIMVSMHSYTPHYLGEFRPWQIDVLSNRDRRVADVMLRELCLQSDICVGDNLPYSLKSEVDYSIPVHAEQRGLLHVLIEIRQNEIGSPAEQDAWAARLLPVFQKAAVELL